MDVIVVDSPVVQKWEDMFKEVCEMNRQLVQELKKKSYELWTAKEVAEYTKLSYKTIISKKEQIGFIAIGDDFRFDPEKVKAFFDRNSYAPLKSKYQK